MSVFKGVSNLNRPDINENIRDNLVTFFDWGFLNAGGYYNVHIPTSGAYGGNTHILRPVVDPRYTNGKVWEGFRSNWIWESGVQQTTKPISISGLYISTTFYSMNSGYYVDYPNGRVVFDTAIATNSTVKIEYGFKLVKVLDSRRVPFFQLLQQDSFRVDSSYFTVGSGIYGMLGDSRIQLPMVGIEMPTSTNQKPYEIGNSSQWLSSDVLCHIVAEDDSMAFRISDAILHQDEKSVPMFDSYLVGLSNAFPLDYRGTLNSSPKTYPDLIVPTGDGGYRYTWGVQNGLMRIKDCTSSNGTWLSSRLYYKTVKLSVETILLNR